MSKKNYKASLWSLFITFFKVGAFTFGGGYAMISVLSEELVVRKKWITDQDMLDMLVIAESTPGVVAVNTATSVGYRMHGVLGAIIATIGVVLPSFLIISVLGFILKQISDNPWYRAAFTGVNACVSVLVINAFLKMGREIKYNWFSILMLAMAFVLTVFTGFNVIYVILIGGVAGVLYTTIRRKVRAKKGLEDDICGDLTQTVEVDGVEQIVEVAGESEQSDEQSQIAQNEQPCEQTAAEVEPSDALGEQSQANSEQVQSDKEER